MTRLGKYLESMGSASRKLWQLASQNFANQVSSNGMAYAVLYYPQMSKNGIWLTQELPILTQKSVQIFIGG